MRPPRYPHFAAPGRLLAAVLIAISTAGTVAAADWQPLLNNSPFGGSPASDAGPAPAQGQVEFRGVVEEDGAYLVNLYDPSTKKSQWIPLEGSAPGLVVNSYDSATDKVVVTQGSRQLTLPLMQARVTLMAAAPPVPSPGSAELDQRNARPDGGGGPPRGPGVGVEGGPAREFIRNLPPEAQAMVEEMRRRRAERLEAMGGRNPNAANRGTQRQR